MGWDDGRRKTVGKTGGSDGEVSSRAAVTEKTARACSKANQRAGKASDSRAACGSRSLGAGGVTSASRLAFRDEGQVDPLQGGAVSAALLLAARCTLAGCWRDLAVCKYKAMRQPYTYAVCV